MIIRPAIANDAERISYLIRRNTKRVEDNGYSPAQIKAWSNQNTVAAIRHKIKTTYLFCAFINDRLVGTGGLDKNMLCTMYVSYSKRGQGIGQNLLKHIEEHARKSNIKELILTATPNGKGFYLRNGFKPYGKIELVFEGVKFMETKMRKSLR